MKATIVILNFNGWEDTIECVRSLAKLKKTPDLILEIVVVDNASSNESVSKIRENLKDIKLIASGINLGFSGGCNLGIRYSMENNSDYIILLNNDTTVAAGLVTSLIKAAKEESVGGVVPKIYFSRGHEFHHERYKNEERGKVIWYAGGKIDWENLIGKNIGVDEVDRGQFDKSGEVELATGCCFLIKTEVLKKVGMFDDRYYLYYEDADLTQRIKRAGYKIMYEPEAFMWHVNAGSSGSGSILQDYYISRNRMLFGMTYASLRTKVSLIRESLKILASGRKWQKRGVIDYYLGRFGHGSFPI